MEQIELIRHAALTLDRLAVPYALVGSWGSGVYGEPRFTREYLEIWHQIVAKVDAPDCPPGPGNP
jgi:hypothetical protein